MLLRAFFARIRAGKSICRHDADFDAGSVRGAAHFVIIIVSLVDILIILLIFFVVSTTFKKDQPEVQINLPESKTAKKQPAEAEHAIVSIDQNDELKLDGRAIGVDELEGAVRNLPETRKSTLALQADKKASFGTIIKVMDALKLAGVRNLPAFTREEK